jgi:murein DD-endopeptidase MepM/ murein hydrolase activator NlpD
MKIIISEQQLNDLLSDITDKAKDVLTKFDDPKKADLISDDVTQFFNTLETIDQPIFQEKIGSMKYQKQVEAVQIGLMILGYDLSKHGADGLFGPETGLAVDKFKQDYDIKDEDLNESFISPLKNVNVTSGYGEKRSYETHGGVDLKAVSGSEVHSPNDGFVDFADFTNSSCGGMVIIKHPDNFTSKFCHIKDIKVSKGQSVKKGDIIGLSGGDSDDKGRGNSRGQHLHFELRKDGKLVNPISYINGEFNNYNQIDNDKDSYITPIMVRFLIDKLKEHGVSIDMLKKYIDPMVKDGKADFTDVDITTPEGYDIYKGIANRFITKRSKNPTITGDMLATIAKETLQMYGKYIPPELALAQIALEGGLDNNPNKLPIITKNPYNIGNTGTKKRFFPSFEEGVRAYYKLIATKYMKNGANALSLVNDFKNIDGNRYASNTEYEKGLINIINSIS